MGTANVRRGQDELTRMPRAACVHKRSASRPKISVRWTEPLWELTVQTTDRKLIAKADKTKLSAAERLVIEKHCRPLSSMLQVKPDARAAFKSNAAWSAVRLKLKHLLQK